MNKCRTIIVRLFGNLQVFCGFLHCFQRLGVFFEQVFHSDCIGLERKFFPNVQTRVIHFWPGKNKLHHRKAYVFKMICFLDLSQSLVGRFDSEPWVASFIRMQHYLLLLCNWNNNYFSVQEHNFDSPWLWDVNHGNSCISLAIFWLHLFN